MYSISWHVLFADDCCQCMQWEWNGSTDGEQASSLGRCSGTDAQVRLSHHLTPAAGWCIEQCKAGPSRAAPCQELSSPECCYSLQYHTNVVLSYTMLFYALPCRGVHALTSWYQCRCRQPTKDVASSSRISHSVHQGECYTTVHKTPGLLCARHAAIVDICMLQ